MDNYIVYKIKDIRLTNMPSPEADSGHDIQSQLVSLTMIYICVGLSDRRCPRPSRLIAGEAWLALASWWLVLDRTDWHLGLGGGASRDKAGAWKGTPCQKGSLFQSFKYDISFWWPREITGPPLAPKSEPSQSGIHSFSKYLVSTYDMNKTCQISMT